MSGSYIASESQRDDGGGIYESGSGESLLLANAYRPCIQLFTDIVGCLSDQASLDPPIITSLQRSRDSLKLWAHGSRRARVGTFRLLVNICRTLLKRLLILVTEDRQPIASQSAVEVGIAIERLRTQIERDIQDSDSDTTSEGFFDNASDPSNIAEDLKTDVRCLQDLGYRFQEKAIRQRSTIHRRTSTQTPQASETPTKYDTPYSV
ncbi:hypothetical protein PG997_000406 [Apiospora hydei]|uniref:Uncharacterized protein n=1 Tax=Apiospora hydei TaxID=1337664 RepID=A0ABR1XAN8_9PEZI